MNASTKVPSNMGGGFEGAIFVGASQAVSYSGTQGQSTQLTSPRCNLLRLVATSAATVQVGLNTDNASAGPTASTTTSMYLPAGVPVFIGVANFVDTNAAWTQLAVVEIAASGVLYITEAN